MKKGRRIIAIDLIRVLAITLIIAFHFIYDYTYANSLRNLGFVGVSLFFIISGFVLAKRYPKLESFSLRWFFKRYLRISVLYYSALIILVVLLGKQVYAGGLVKNLVAHFLFIDFLFKETAYGITSAAWFIPPLIALYLMFPYLNKFTKKSLWFLVFIFTLMISARLYSGALSSYSPLFFIGEFCFGIAYAHGKKILPLAISLFTVFLFPVMVLPFIIFSGILLFEWNIFPSKLLHFIGANTLALFLFHEAFIKIFTGKWSIPPLTRFNALFLLVTFAIVATHYSRVLRGKILSTSLLTKKKDLNSNKTGKNMTKKTKSLKLLFLFLIAGYSSFLLISIVFPSTIQLSPASDSKTILTVSDISSNQITLKDKCYSKVEGFVTNKGTSNALNVIVTCNTARYPLVSKTKIGTTNLGQLEAEDNKFFSIDIQTKCNSETRFECFASCNNC